MRSLRLDPELDERVQRAAAAEGSTVSEFLRAAAAERCDRTLAESTTEQLGDVIGAINGGGGRARESGKAFSDLLAEQDASA